MKHDYQRTISDFQIIFEERDLASWQNITNLNECVGNFGEDSLRVEDRSISFVGYKIYHDYTLIRKNIKHKMCKKVAAMNKLKHMTYSEYRQQVCSHISWMKHCNGINLLKKIIKYHQLIEYARSS